MRAMIDVSTLHETFRPHPPPRRKNAAVASGPLNRRPTHTRYCALPKDEPAPPRRKVRDLWAGIVSAKTSSRSTKKAR